MNFMQCACFTYRRKLLKVLLGTDFIPILYTILKKGLLFQISKEATTNEQNREVKGLVRSSPVINYFRIRGRELIIKSKEQKVELSGVILHRLKITL